MEKIGKTLLGTALLGGSLRYGNPNLNPKTVNTIDSTNKACSTIFRNEVKLVYDYTKPIKGRVNSNNCKEVPSVIIKIPINKHQDPVTGITTETYKMKQTYTTICAQKEGIVGYGKKIETTKKAVGIDCKNRKYFF